MEAILPIHIAAGTASVLTGAAALLLRKGGRSHRLAGTVFVAAMLIMSATIVLLAAMKTLSAGDVGAAVLTIYFVATAWVTVRRKGRRTGVFEIVAFALAVLLAGGILNSAIALATGAREAENPVITGVSFVLAGFMALAAAGDLSVVLRRGISGGQRIARHLWRMCLGLFIAVGSFAAQGAEALPDGVPRVELLLASMVLVLGAMAYWLVRVLFTKWRWSGEQLS
jgi:uncharacterized membrane protein